MSRMKSAITASALILSLGLITAPGVFAKGHNQGATESPGTDVGTETVGESQGEGAALGGGKGPSGTPGNSEDAGRPDSAGSGNSGESGASGSTR